MKSCTREQRKILQDMYDDIQSKSEETFITDEDGKDTTGRVIKNTDLEAIRMKYLG